MFSLCSCDICCSRSYSFSVRVVVPSLPTLFSGVFLFLLVVFLVLMWLCW